MGFTLRGNAYLSFRFRNRMTFSILELLGMAQSAHLQTAGRGQGHWR
jgi:hypothetical protein